MQKYFNNLASPLTGRAIAGASVQVNVYGGGAATIYSDNGVTPKTNPLTTDANGYFEFYAADGRYSLVISGVGVTSTTIADVLLEDPADANAGNFSNIIVSGSLTLGGVAASALSALGSLVLLSVQEASNSAQIDFTGLTTAYDRYLLSISGLTPVVDVGQLYMRYSIDNGSSFQTTNYTGLTIYDTPSTTVKTSNVSQPQFSLGTNISNVDTRSVSGEIWLNKIGTNTKAQSFESSLNYYDASNEMRLSRTFGAKSLSPGAVNAIRLYMASGNISTGSFALYGVRKS